MINTESRKRSHAESASESPPAKITVSILSPELVESAKSKKPNDGMGDGKNELSSVEDKIVREMKKCVKNDVRDNDVLVKKKSKAKDGKDNDVIAKNKSKSKKKDANGNIVLAKKKIKIKDVNDNEAGDKKKFRRKGVKDSEKKTKLEELKKKERKKVRKSVKNNFEKTVLMKKIWEQLRKQTVESEKRQEMCLKLHEMVKGNAHDLIFAHDTSRVIQCLVKFASPEVKNDLFEELKEHILEMMKSTYAKFFVRRMMKYGTPPQRTVIFTSMYGNVRKLVKHKEAAAILEVAYNDYANAAQRASLIEEFYGPTFALFKTGDAQTLEQIMATEPEKKVSILKNMRETIPVLMDKQICQLSIVHKVLLEFFTHATEKLRTEMIEVVRESLVHMVHTHDGSHVAMHAMWHGTAKDRKVIVKSLKSYVVKIAKEDYGHLVLLAIFDCVDDTKLVHKVVLEELLKDVAEVAADAYGRKTLLYLLAPRDSHHFHPDIVRILERGDGNTLSKKEVSVRRAELLAAASPALLVWVVEHVHEAVKDNALLLVVTNVLQHAAGNQGEAMRAVCRLAAEPYAGGSSETTHIIEHPVGHVALKKLILSDKGQDDAPFSTLLLSSLAEGALAEWTRCNRGCFVLVSLMELENTVISQRVRDRLAGAQLPPDSKGAHVLKRKLEGE